jgi:hypothetical protein
MLPHFYLEVSRYTLFTSTMSSEYFLLVFLLWGLYSKRDTGFGLSFTTSFTSFLLVEKVIGKVVFFIWGEDGMSDVFLMCLLGLKLGLCWKLLLVGGIMTCE